MYADVSRYSGVDSVQYLFEYELVKKPRGNITITPVLKKYVSNDSMVYDTSTTALLDVSNLDIFPISKTFTRDDSDTISSLQGEFVIASRYKSLFGYYSIEMFITGSTALEYQGNIANFELLSDYSSPIPPTLLRASFGVNGASVSVVFDSSTDYGISATTSSTLSYLPSTWSCDLILSFIGANVTTCSWISETTIRLSFPSISSSSTTTTAAVLIIPGNSITLLSNTVRAACVVHTECETYEYSVSSTVYTTAPPTPAAPVVVWNMPIEIGNCENLTVDATASYGSGGRPWASVSFTVSATSTSSLVRDTSVANINSHLSSATSAHSTISIPGGLLNTTLVYYFNVKLTNYLGAASDGTSSVIRSSSTDIPEISFKGRTTQDIQAKDGLSLKVSGSVSGCGSSISEKKLSYKWLVYKDLKFDATVISESIESRQMKLSGRHKYWDKFKYKSEIEGSFSLYWWRLASCGVVHWTALMFFYHTL